MLENCKFYVVKSTIMIILSVWKGSIFFNKLLSLLCILERLFSFEGVPEIKLQLGFAKLFLFYNEMHIWNLSSDLKWNYIQGTISFARFSFFTQSQINAFLVSKGYSWKCISFLDQWFWSNDSVGKISSGFLMAPWIKKEIVLKVFHLFI